MRFSIWPGPAQPFADVLELSRHAEATGWDGVWFADHFMPNAADNSGPTNEAWTTIAALCAVVPRVRIGTLVTGNTYRHPAVLAKMAANCDQISGGRLVLGLGSGWQENEHEAYGIPFSTVPGRLNRLDEACHVIRGLFENERTTFDGKYYQLKDAPLNPKPVQNPVPILIGGGGEQKTMKIAAKYANEWNVWGSVDLLRQKGAVLDGHCEAMGRDPKEILHSAQGIVLPSASHPMATTMGPRGTVMFADNADQVREVVAAYRDAGVHELIVPDFFMGSNMELRKNVCDQFIAAVGKDFR
jgi:F420-dependent oxidoreductase-like protein